MNEKQFKVRFAALIAAFPNSKVDDAVAKVYYEMLKDIPEKDFDDGVRDCLVNCKFFPTISELGEASLPTFEELAPYNPRVYHDPIKVNWRDQLDRQEAKQIQPPPREKLPPPAECSRCVALEDTNERLLNRVHELEVMVMRRSDSAPMTPEERRSRISLLKGQAAMLRGNDGEGKQEERAEAEAPMSGRKRVRPKTRTPTA